MLTAVGDEGGFAPDFTDAKEVFSYLKRAVEKAGYQPGTDFAFAMDAAASELYDEQSQRYVFPGEGKERDREEMILLYEELINEFPLISIEDGLDEEDWEGWKEFTGRMTEYSWRMQDKEEPQRLMLVGDDLFVTNTKRIRCGIGMDAGNAVLVKVNQIGTLTEALDAIACAQRAGYQTIISHRSGETEDSFIADLAVAVNAGWIKTGAPCRGERTAKYNELLRISEKVV
jgi:enolase